MNSFNGSLNSSYPLFIAQKYKEDMEKGDEDVKKEYEYVKKHHHDLPFSAMHISKEFKCKGMFDSDTKEYIKQKKMEDLKYGEPHLSFYTNKIVKTVLGDINFGLRPHECLGLLGPNGAGKSTLLNIFTGYLPPTTGQVYYQGKDIKDSKSTITSFGYCPQNDILWRELTLREHIEFFLSLRGYEKEDVNNYATKFISTCGLEEHQNKRIHYLSGGTKRKLSLILVICNYPKLIFLDEPTSGIDPSTRRLIWNIIQEIKERNNSSIILTTHSIDEASYLCERLGILVNGRLRYIGTSENLKMKYGNSYILEVQSDFVDSFHNQIVENAFLFENHPYKVERLSIQRVKYEIQFSANKNIGHIFYMMEKCKSSRLITDYSFSQTTLEQVFLNFSKNQINEI
jgi:ABC-type multidrug transport system ATPase subunit